MPTGCPFAFSLAPPIRTSSHEFGLHPDLVPHALAVHGREVDVVVGKCRPGLVILVEGDLPADGGDLAVLLLDGFDEACDVDEELAVEMRAAGAVPSEQVVARSGRGFGSRTRGHVRDRDVVDGDGNLVLLAPVLCELVEPFVVSGNEVAPLHDRQRLGVGHRAGHKGRRHRAGGDEGATRLLQETASRDARKPANAHSNPPPFGLSG